MAKTRIHVEGARLNGSGTAGQFRISVDGEERLGSPYSYELRSDTVELRARSFEVLEALDDGRINIRLHDVIMRNLLSTQDIRIRRAFPDDDAPEGKRLAIAEMEAIVHGFDLNGTES